MPIVSFGDRATETFFVSSEIKKHTAWCNIAAICRRKLDMLHYATALLDLSSPPGNRLEALAGRLNGFYSIRISKQWRIIFIWTSNGPAEVKICDYH